MKMILFLFYCHIIIKSAARTTIQNVIYVCMCVFRIFNNKITIFFSGTTMLCVHSYVFQIDINLHEQIGCGMGWW